MKVKYVNQPKKPDGKFGNIRSDDGETYFVNVGCLNKYRVGMEIEPPFDNKKWGQDVVKVIPPHYDPSAGGAPPQPPPLNGSYNQTPAPPPARTNGALGKEGEMFVMGVVGRAMGSGKFDPTDVDVLTKAAVQAWRNNVA